MKIYNLNILDILNYCKSITWGINIDIRIAEDRFFVFCEVERLVYDDVVEAGNAVGTHVQRWEIALLFQRLKSSDAQFKQQVGIEGAGIEIVAVRPGNLAVDFVIGGIVLLEMADFLMKIPQK